MGQVAANTEPVTMMLALFDVLGFRERLRTRGLPAIRSEYARLISLAEARAGQLDLWKNWRVETYGYRDPKVECLAASWVPVDHSYFSDTILFWAPYEQGHVAGFCRFCSLFMCQSLHIHIPVRGAITIGEMVIDKTVGVFLGLPLAEALDAEKSQAWLGVTFGPSFAMEPHNRFDVNVAIPYTRHRKAGTENVIPGVVLDWPRLWPTNTLWDPEQLISEMDTDPRFSAYYERTREFVKYSRVNRNWFITGRPPE
jgi:hypothetical protein